MPSDIETRASVSDLTDLQIRVILRSRFKHAGEPFPDVLLKPENALYLRAALAAPNYVEPANTVEWINDCKLREAAKAKATKEIVDLYDWEKGVPKDPPGTKPKGKRKKYDFRPVRTGPKSTKLQLELEFTEAQTNTIALWHQTKVSIWETLKERNLDHFRSTGRYYTYKEVRPLYAELKRLPEYAWWNDMPAEFGRATAANVVNAFLDYSDAGGGRRLHMLEQKSIESYPFSRDVKFVKRTTPHPKLPWREIPYNKLALRFPGLGEVKLKALREQVSFLRKAEFNIHWSRIWKSPTTEKWWVEINYTQVDPYAVWKAVAELWKQQPNDVEFLPTEVILAELAKRGVRTNKQRLAEALDLPSEREWFNGRQVRGYRRYTSERWPNSTEQLELREQDELLDPVELLDPAARTPRKKLPPQLATPSPPTRKRLPQLVAPPQLTEPAITPEQAEIYARLAEMQLRTATGLRKQLLEKRLLALRTEVTNLR